MTTVYRFMLACYAALALTLVAWIWDDSVSRWWLRAGWTAVALVPLALPLRGILRSNRKAYAGATLCAIPYIVVALTESVAVPERRVWAGICLVSSFAWFIALIAALRLSRPPVEHARDEGNAEPPLRGE
jgi:uncharacterized membrane protein